ncbi:ABC transporter ATP-binding protein [Clostridium perfringens]|uniref:Peptide ABC transporter ATP-binding protein n=1 Tax=Clostridium perfringens TaxID=1502 RepID=A0A127EH08_CLOPF|nr:MULTISPECIES: oligopeptide/dipeptide ABC transporter ATP-binding protein [Clostridium]AMN35217.1 peptide ABC transporter ATP-binding protein [Clostridium perfringens]MDK7589579.1 ATP-binding cassette domain-containing protein [Clostridium sp. UMB9555B]MDK7628028.1 ATP-binding cassette domain-containing protein [Clostridium sp. UMB9555A]HAT4071425.1 ATP-binding cassette domain-containing protein [Clostridium perfringens]HAT4092762.1 ATP-binding cassette domain-containing protein [Clostridium
MGKEVLLEVKDLKKYFKIGKDKTLKAVDGVSFTINKGETLGLVGESGCGKTTCGRTIMGLYDVTGGEIILDGKNITNLSNKEKRANSRICQMIFQDPYASLNPRMTVGDIIAEGIDIHKLYTGEERTKKIYELLELVGLNKEHASRFAHEFSGGQRQRIGIARALAVEPKFIVCDEPISALDVSIQAQVVNLLINLQRRMGLTYLFIAHDLSMVRHISDKVGVMYLGNIVEISGSINVYEHPLHPYTKALMSSIPLPEYRNEKRTDRIVLEGEVSSPINPKLGCRFASRCKYANDICFKEQPKLKEVEKEHFVACHLYD